MPRFSQRHAGRPLQVSGLEEATVGLRTATWNQIHEGLFPEGGGNHKVSYKANAGQLWNFLGLPTDELPGLAFDAKKQFKAWWFEFEWDQFFDTLEFITQLLNRSFGNYFRRMNNVLEAQGCAYRFVGNELGPITSPIELMELEVSLESAIPAVAEHIRQAVAYMPPNPGASARNSIKESISAVESALRVLTGDHSGKMGPALSAFESKYGDMHPSLRAGLLKMYGFTSDEGGIRHALIEETANVTLADARFMLVACSAFANYLVALSAQLQ